MSISFFPTSVGAQKIVSLEEDSLKVQENRAWYSKCPRGCQWDTSMDCGSKGASSCTVGNGCGNCNQS